MVIKKENHDEFMVFRSDKPSFHGVDPSLVGESPISEWRSLLDGADTTIDNGFGTFDWLG